MGEKMGIFDGLISVSHDNLIVPYFKLLYNRTMNWQKF